VEAVPLPNPPLKQGGDFKAISGDLKVAATMLFDKIKKKAVFKATLFST
jgi:hypothetical protein